MWGGLCRIFSLTAMTDPVSYFLQITPDLEAMYWSARIVRGRRLYALWHAQSPDSDVLDYGKGVLFSCAARLGRLGPRAPRSAAAPEPKGAAAPAPGDLVRLGVG